MMASKEISLQDRVTVVDRQISLCLQVRLVRPFVCVVSWILYVRCGIIIIRSIYVPN